MNIALDLETVHNFKVRHLKSGSAIATCTKCELQLFSNNGIYAEIEDRDKLQYQRCDYSRSNVPKRVRIDDNRLGYDGVSVGKKFDVVKAPFSTILKNTLTQITIMGDNGQYYGFGINQVTVLR